MQLTIYIPKKEECEIMSARKAAIVATETGGLGAYFIMLHKQETARRDDEQRNY